MRRVLAMIFAFVICMSNICVASAEEETIKVISQEDVKNYFSDAVFIGDSVGLGFSNYVGRNKDVAVSNMTFLTSGGFGAVNALKTVTAESVHPIYEGQRRYIWDSIHLMGAKKVFLSYGINDLNPARDRIVDMYKQVIDKIVEESPEVEINIVSITYALKGSESGRINNIYIKEVNEQLKSLADENGWGYLDIASKLEDEEGNLQTGYCSDGFVHLSRMAYQLVWSPVFEDFAKSKLEEEGAVWVESCEQIVNCVTRTEVYDAPAESAKEILSIQADTKILVTGTMDNGYCRVNLGDGKDYYVKRENVSF